jgi:methylated-DNA-[protein]-cysteine S-methyltransferase
MARSASTHMPGARPPVSRSWPCRASARGRPITWRCVASLTRMPFPSATWHCNAGRPIWVSTETAQRCLPAPRRGDPGGQSPSPTCGRHHSSARPLSRRSRERRPEANRHPPQFTPGRQSMTTTGASQRTTDESRDLSTAQRVMATPIGPLTLVADEIGLRAVTWPDEDGSRVGLAGRLKEAPAGDRGSDVPPNSRAEAVLDAAERQLVEYFEGGRSNFDLPMHLVGTEFQQEAWRALAKIPFGQTISYGEQAARLGRPKAVRAVGSANGRNPLSRWCCRATGSSVPMGTSPGLPPVSTPSAGCWTTSPVRLRCPSSDQVRACCGRLGFQRCEQLDRCVLRADFGPRLLDPAVGVDEIRRPDDAVVDLAIQLLLPP